MRALHSRPRPRAPARMLAPATMPATAGEPPTRLPQQAISQSASRRGTPRRGRAGRSSAMKSHSPPCPSHPPPPNPRPTRPDACHPCRTFNTADASCQFKNGTTGTLSPKNGGTSGTTRTYYPPVEFSKDRNTGCNACGFVPRDFKIRWVLIHEEGEGAGEQTSVLGWPPGGLHTVLSMHACMLNAHPPTRPPCPLQRRRPELPAAPAAPV